MNDFNPDEAGIRRLLEEIGQQVRQVVQETVDETHNQSLESAVVLLHHRLNGIQGAGFDRDWAQNAVETLRRGDDLEINIG